MKDEIPDNEKEALEKLIDQTLDNLKKRPHREMTEAGARGFIRKWHSEYNYFEKIIELAYHQAWVHRNTLVAFEDIDEFLALWHEEKLKSPAEVRAFEKDQGREIN